jgi:hypothetical protein
MPQPVSATRRQTKSPPRRRFERRLAGETSTVTVPGSFPMACRALVTKLTMTC